MFVTNDRLIVSAERRGHCVKTELDLQAKTCEISKEPCGQRYVHYLDYYNIEIIYLSIIGFADNTSDILYSYYIRTKIYNNVYITYMHIIKKRGRSYYALSISYLILMIYYVIIMCHVI